MSVANQPGLAITLLVPLPWSPALGPILSHPLLTEEVALWGPGSRTRAEHCTPQSGWSGTETEIVGK